MYKMVECVIFVCFFCNDSFSMCDIATSMYGFGLGLGKKVLLTSLLIRYWNGSRYRTSSSAMAERPHVFDQRPAVFAKS